MSFTEDQEILSLFSDDVSLWGRLHDGDVDRAVSSKSSKESELQRLDSFDALSPESGEMELKIEMKRKYSGNIRIEELHCVLKFK